jgi:hypothetical protein
LKEFVHHEGREVRKIIFSILCVIRFARLVQISRCAKAKRAGVKPTPTTSDSFFAPFEFLAAIFFSVAASPR